MELVQGKVIRLVSDDLDAVLSMARAADVCRLPVVVVLTVRAFPGDLLLQMIFGALILAGLFFKGDCFMTIECFVVGVEESKRNNK